MTQKKKAQVFSRDAEGNPTRWVISIELGRGEGGSRKRKRIYGLTEAEVLRKAERMLADIDAGVDATKDRVRVSDHMRQYLEFSRGRLAPATWDSYRCITEDFIIPELGHIFIARLSIKQVDDFLNDIKQRSNPRTGKPYAGSYVNKIRAVLRAALRQAQRWEYIPIGRNVAALAMPAKVRKKKIRPPSNEQIRRVLSVVEGHRYTLIYHALVMLGMRRGEVLAIRWVDVDLETGTVLVTGTLQRQHRRRDDGNGAKTSLVRADKTKGEAGDDRLIVMPPSMVVRLRQLKEHQELEKVALAKLGLTWPDHGLVFTTTRGTPVEPRQLSKHFKTEVIPAAGLPETTRLHDLRHSNVSAMIASGVDLKTAQERAGHADVRTTLNVYAHSNIDLQRAAAAALDALYGGDFTTGGGATDTEKGGH